jgi:cation diffusion facilitator family transporter
MKLPYISKMGASILSVIAVGLLISIKVVGSVITGSIGIRADAIHSAIDLVGVLIGFAGIRISGKPPDEGHAFGHEKAENIAGVAIAGLIGIAAVIIIYEAVKRIVSGGTVELVSAGIYITVAAIMINVLVAWYTSKIAKSNDSLALEATARDMFADALSSVAVLLGLVLVRLTGLNILDQIAAIFVSMLIARTALLTMRRSFSGLMDTRLPEEEEEAIKSIIAKYGDSIVGFHQLRTRKSGSQRFVDFHLVVPKHVSVDEAHELCDRLERDIAEKLARSNVTIHVEPCNNECKHCAALCAEAGQSPPV